MKTTAIWKSAIPVFGICLLLTPLASATDRPGCGLAKAKQVTQHAIQYVQLLISLGDGGAVIPPQPGFEEGMGSGTDSYQPSPNPGGAPYWENDHLVREILYRLSSELWTLSSLIDQALVFPFTRMPACMKVGEIQGIIVGGTQAAGYPTAGVYTASHFTPLKSDFQTIRFQIGC